MDIDKIYCEDCIEGMKRIPDGAVDAIIADPPYCVGVSSNGVRSSWQDNSLIRPFFNALFAEFKRVSKTGAYIYVNCDWRTYPVFYPIALAHLNVRNLIVWDLEHIKCGNFYRYSHELILFATNGKAMRGFGAGERDVWRVKHYVGRHHPSEKPVELITKMILHSTNQGELVLDPFMGSGSTAVACVNSNRHFIGFETHQPFVDVCNRRIGEARDKLQGSAQELF